jgi:hypothetical protein
MRFRLADWRTHSFYYSRQQRSTTGVVPGSWCWCWVLGFSYLLVGSSVRYSLVYKKAIQNVYYSDYSRQRWLL